MGIPKNEEARRSLSFRELYEAAKAQGSPGQLFLEEVAALTHRSKHTVRMWIIGRQTPDPNVMEKLVDIFQASPEELFPKEEPKD